MTEIERDVSSADVIKNYFIGSLVSEGGSVPAKNASAKAWIKMVNGFQKGALSTRLGIPMIYGIDAVHGHNNVYNTTVFPHNVGLGATRDPELVKKIGAATALEAFSYYDAIIKGVSTVIVSYSSWNGVKMHANRDLVTGFLKNTLRFRGFVISDWEAIDGITSPPHANYTYSIEMAINAGVDMVMVPANYTEFIDGLTSLAKKNVIPMSCIDDAVKRILRVKFVTGLFENPLADDSLVDQLGSQHRELAREAVRKSLVLLKNGESADRPLLPLPKKTSKILVAGTHADNLGYKCGGWTIEWLGLSGNNITSGTTILTAIKNTVDQQTKVVFEENPDANFVKSNNFAYAIVVVGEHPYTETKGDSLNLTIPDHGPRTITNVCGAVKCVVVVISGRPVVLEPYISSMDALVTAWLPGSEGQGVTDVLFGDYGFTGKLPRTWFKTVDRLPVNVGDSHYDPVFPFGFGLTTKSTMAN
ncbi:hypothetical protein Patl1_22850 [Pistacia atlantica]|uniref:Uncharacterized protein n=1 Tax=Pistacia atlantica TaxID=434234 RepID=A0ACC0ZY95_9ROSI|nr:hypothetical protein Patl1_22850 [Pistacia atlantica]